jgi:hypothetical protein
MLTLEPESSENTFSEKEQRKRDELLLKLLKTPPEQRPKREREKSDPTNEPGRSQR